MESALCTLFRQLLFLNQKFHSYCVIIPCPLTSLCEVCYFDVRTSILDTFLIKFLALEVHRPGLLCNQYNSTGLFAMCLKMKRCTFYSF